MRTIPPSNLEYSPILLLIILPISNPVNVKIKAHIENVRESII